MKLYHHAPISSIRAPILSRCRAASPFPIGSITNCSSKSSPTTVSPYPTRLIHLDGKLKILSSSLASSSLPSNKYHTINTDKSRPVYVRSQVGEEEAMSLNDPIFKRTVRFVYAVWRLLRPFVLYETIIASFAWTARAFLEKPLGQPMGLSIQQALSALFVMVCCQGFMSGINQIYDRDIDIINKPFLPISSGDLSVNTAWALVLCMVVSGFTVVIANGASPLIMTLYCLYVIIVGVLYSVPPFRWKRFASGAFFVMASHGAILNLGLYLALKDTVSFPFPWSFQMTFITMFMTLQGIVNNLIKDLSDIEGDRKHNIMTPAVVFGPKKTMYMGVGIFLLMYVVGMVMSVLMPHTFRGTLVIPMHGLFSFFLIFQVRVLVKAKYAKEACLKFYMALWHLRYAEYIMFLFM